MESMRSVGYTLEAALADLVDNSISAGSTEVDIEFSTEPYDYVSIVDNGSGMSLGGATGHARPRWPCRTGVGS